MAMTPRKRKNKPQPNRREQPHLLRNQWHEFAPDPEKRAKLQEELDRGLSVYEAAPEPGYSERRERRAQRLEPWM
jgi:hypothetical protein